ncbi:MAG: class I tRNA ligase family protein, partial [Mucinivorans sp.]
MEKFKQYDGLNLTQVAMDVLSDWKKNNTFQNAVNERQNAPRYIFFEGPPSANGVPGIHHVMARTIKDIFCRYKTQQGFCVERKAGWDTHGLPVELGVEKKLGITKENIGRTISIENYNKECRADVMKYTALWRELTEKMGYWVDMDQPYITYENDYIETLWHLLQMLFDKGLLYKGYTIQPYSPAAGTGLSNHELNQPGCYRDVKDTTCIAQFKAVGHDNLFLLAWTTTPWTLPSNTALAVGPTVDYVRLSTINPYSKKTIEVIVAEKLVDNVMGKNEYQILERMKGAQMEGMCYEQLIPWIKPNTDNGKQAFKVICGDFVTTEDGTGIVHIAPTFGADDDRVAKQNNIAPLMVVDTSGAAAPMV